MFLILPKGQWVPRGGEGRAERQRQHESGPWGGGVLRPAEEGTSGLLCPIP